MIWFFFANFIGLYFSLKENKIKNISFQFSILFVWLVSVCVLYRLNRFLITETKNILISNKNYSAFFISQICLESCELRLREPWYELCESVFIIFLILFIMFRFTPFNLHFFSIFLSVIIISFCLFLLVFFCSLGLCVSVWWEMYINKYLKQTPATLTLLYCYTKATNERNIIILSHLQTTHTEQQQKKNLFLSFLASSSFVCWLVGWLFGWWLILSFIYVNNKFLYRHQNNNARYKNTNWHTLRSTKGMSVVDDRRRITKA